MIFLHVLVHFSCCDKTFTAYVTFMISQVFMNPFDVKFFFSWCTKRFLTNFTLVIFVAFMNCMHWYVSSNFLLKYHNIHIYDICHPHVMLQISKLRKKIYHMINICDLCSFHGLCKCVSSKNLIEKIVFHKIHISDLCERMNCVDVLLRPWSFKPVTEITGWNYGFFFR